MHVSRKKIGWTPTRRQNNTDCIIHSISAKKSVMHNEERKTNPQNSQIHHIRCICVLLDGSSEQPGPRQTGPEITYCTSKTVGLRISETPQQTPECHSRKSSDPHLQEIAIPPEHRNSTTHHRIFFIWHDIMGVLYNPQRRDEKNIHSS